VTAMEAEFAFPDSGAKAYPVTVRTDAPFWVRFDWRPDQTQAKEGAVSWVMHRAGAVSRFRVSRSRPDGGKTQVWLAFRAPASGNDRVARLTLTRFGADRRDTLVGDALVTGPIQILPMG